MRKTLSKYNRAADYSDISSLEELRIARTRIKREIEQKEEELSEDYELFIEAISPIAYAKRVLDKVISIKFVIENIINGYNFAKSIIDKIRGKEEKRASNNTNNCPQEEEEANESKSNSKNSSLTTVPSIVITITLFILPPQSTLQKEVMAELDILYSHFKPLPSAPIA